MDQTVKILIADDEKDCVDFVCETLADTPYEMLVAMDGQEALNLARQHKPQLIILDVQMPKKDGFGVFAELKADKDLANVPVIMLTGVAERTGVKTGADDMAQYLDAEPEAYIDKPIEPIVLKQVVNRLLKK